MIGDLIDNFGDTSAGVICQSCHFRLSHCAAQFWRRLHSEQCENEVAPARKDRFSPFKQDD